ncbi:MAG TPA: hypothetical protein PKW95_22265 [bacterium]|nr:hypothetical protein [bacterium]
MKNILVPIGILLCLFAMLALACGDDDDDNDSSVDDDDNDSGDDDTGDDDTGGDDDDGVWFDDYVVFAANDLGMHCMNQDFSEALLLPPYNTLHAQVIDRRDEHPRIVNADKTLTYAIPGNTHSADKTNFWEYVDDLLGVTLADDIGLTGNGLAGGFVASGAGGWIADGIPLTPLDDAGVENPYQLATVTVYDGNNPVAQTRAVVPVSWEINCDLCHNTAGISPATDILRKHDALHATDLENAKPVFCGGCHYQAPLAPFSVDNGEQDPLSLAMHSAHASRMGAAGLDNPCYACHPGVETQCQRDVHFSEGLTCVDCHISMEAVGYPLREPWVDEPRCDNCHTRSGFEFEQPGTLYRNSKGHRGVFCASCHGSPHAIGPSVVDADNAQAIGLQGHAGVIDTCTVCHREEEDDEFPHRLDEDDDDDDDDDEDDDDDK